jgi:hypothetical protein
LCLRVFGVGLYSFGFCQTEEFRCDLCIRRGVLVPYVSFLCVCVTVFLTPSLLSLSLSLSLSVLLLLSRWQFWRLL